MRRLMVICLCGERIQVPRSAIGKKGLCPACGRVIAIAADSAVPLRSQPQTKAAPAQGTWHTESAGPPTEEAKRRFAEAVDLYFSQRYAESLAVFAALAAQYPAHPEIETAQAMCLGALRRSLVPALEHKPAAAHARAEGDAPFRTTDEVVPRAARRQKAPEDLLNERSLGKFLLEKMLHGSSEGVQLRAAELAVKVFGYMQGNHPPDGETTELEKILDEHQDERRVSGGRPEPYPPGAGSR